MMIDIFKIIIAAALIVKACSSEKKAPEAPKTKLCGEIHRVEKIANKRGKITMVLITVVTPDTTLVVKGGKTSYLIPEGISGCLQNHGSGEGKKAAYELMPPPEIRP